MLVVRFVRSSAEFFPFLRRTRRPTATDGDKMDDRFADSVAEAGGGGARMVT